MRIMMFAVVFVLTVFGAQLVRIQGIDAGTVSAEALKERTGKTALPALRGQIVDRNGVVLASSTERETVVVDQTAVCTYRTRKNTCSPATSTTAVAAVAERLSQPLGIPTATLVPMLTGTSRYRILSKDVSSLAWRQINAMGLPGVYHEATQPAPRSYPISSAAAALVGFVHKDGVAGGGLEVMLDKVLKGTDGSVTYEQAANGQPIPDGAQTGTPTVPGRNVRLTIDANLQWYAQNLLAAKVAQTQALSGTVVVLDVHTGKVRAIASYPTFDPNNVGGAKVSLNDLAFTDVFEPGSTAKLMTMSAALQEGKVTPTTTVVIPSKLHRSDKDFHDAEPHGTEVRTVAGTLAQSSNMGTMLVGETMTATTLDSYFRKFGLGSTSGIGFPGESAGLLAPVNQWNGSQRYTVMFGQGLSVTAVQVASVFQTIANGGVRIPPRLVDAVADDNGSYVATPQPAGITVVSPTVAAQMSRMLEGVVSKDGTAPAAQIAGYRVAGKTGTADRIDPVRGGYTGGKTASFVGFAPADKPQLVVAVIIQRPVRGYFGGIVAAPVFHDVMTYALQAFAIPPTGNSVAPYPLIPTGTGGGGAVLRDRRTLGHG